MKKYIRSSLLYSPYYEKWKSFLKENVHGDVPEEVLMETAEYLGSDGTISLHDAFSEACRDCAPKGSELYKDWYNGDLRKYIPSEYVESSTSIKCSTRDPYKVDCLKEILQNMQDYVFFVPKLKVNGDGLYIDLDEGAIQVLIDYYN